MAESKASERLILKILNGIQSGVEVSLSPGEYSFGSGNDDDIQLIDVSLKPNHLKLRVAPGKIEIRAQSGTFHTVGGLEGRSATDDWSEVQPLDVITAGTTRFALGLPTAQWATVTDDDLAQAPSRPAASKSGPSIGAVGTGVLTHSRSLAIPIAAVCIILAASAWLMFADTGRLASRNKGNELEIARTTIEQFPFAKAVTLRQDVDGTIYANGFVESLVERRAVTEAIEKTGIPVRVRLQVLQVMRSELDNLISAEKVNVSYTLPETGVATLDGTILNAATADRFISRVRESIAGLSQVDMRIKTAKSLLEDVEKLARTTQIDQAVIFRLDKDVIEANGIITPNKIDSWVGFLQAYARRYSKDISLRSFVQLQYDPNTPLSQRLSAANGQPIMFGPDTKPDDLNIGDLFAGLAPDGKTPTGPLALLQSPGSRIATAAGLDARNDAGKNAPPIQPRPGPVAAKPDAPKGDDLSNMADGLLQRWLRGDAQGVGSALDTLAAEALGLGKLGEKVDDAARRRFAQQFLPLLARNPADRPDIDTACRPGSRLKTTTVPAALFWLDILSSTDAVSLATFDTKTQGEVLEAALDPKLVRACLERDRAARPLIKSSIYLSEASRNPDFVEYVTRSLPAFDIRVTGASMSDTRFIQTIAGEKIREGASPDPTSRIDVIGELGMSVQVASGFSRVIYGPGINWLSSR